MFEMLWFATQEAQLAARRVADGAIRSSQQEIQDILTCLAEEEEDQRRVAPWRATAAGVEPEKGAFSPSHFPCIPQMDGASDDPQGDSERSNASKRRKNKWRRVVGQSGARDYPFLFRRPMQSASTMTSLSMLVVRR